MGIGDFTFAMLSEHEKKLPFYLIGAGSNFHQELDPHKRPSGYPDYQWIQVKSGKGTFIIQGKSYVIGENQGILLFPDVPHEYYALESPWIVNWFTFNGDGIKEFLKQINIEESGKYLVTNPSIFLTKIRRALELLRYPKMKIEEITLKSGYKSSSYYCSKFQKIEGMTPGEFRDLYSQMKDSQTNS